MDKDKLLEENLKNGNKIFLLRIADYANDIDVLAELAYYAKNQELKTEDCLEFEGYTASKLKDLLPNTPITEIYYYMRKLKHIPEFKTFIEEAIAREEYYNSDEYKKHLEKKQKFMNIIENEEEKKKLYEELKKIREFFDSDQCKIDFEKELNSIKTKKNEDKKNEFQEKLEKVINKLEKEIEDNKNK